MSTISDHPVKPINQPEFITSLSAQFNTGVENLHTQLQAALKALTGNGTNSDTSDPVKLAEYQAALSAYTLFCNAQSSSVKAYKDIAAATISNFR